MLAGIALNCSGVFDVLEYSDEYPIPFTMPLQEDKFALCSELTEEFECRFTFPKSKAKTCPLRGVPKKPLIWRYIIQTVDDGEGENRNVITTYGYFMVSRAFRLIRNHM